MEGQTFLHCRAVETILPQVDATTARCQCCHLLQTSPHLYPAIANFQDIVRNQRSVGDSILPYSLVWEH